MSCVFACTEKRDTYAYLLRILSFSRVDSGKCYLTGNYFLGTSLQRKLLWPSYRFKHDAREAVAAQVLPTASEGCFMSLQPSLRRFAAPRPRKISNMVVFLLVFRFPKKGVPFKSKTSHPYMASLALQQACLSESRPLFAGEIPGVRGASHFCQASGGCDLLCQRPGGWEKSEHPAPQP